MHIKRAYINWSMALSMLTSTLTVLQSLEKSLLKAKPLSESSMTNSWPEKWRATFKMVLISAAVGGIELCYSAETAFVSPLLLRLGVPVYLMTMSWMASPILGFFLVPILGSASDTCTSKLGRRRPFIILYSIGIIIGLILVPYGQDIGVLLGDRQALTINETCSSELSNITFNSTLPVESLSASLHPIGVVFTILGVMTLDFCCDACQTPCRTLMIDQITTSEHSQGLTTFTIVAGLGGAVGYGIGGVKWNLPKYLKDPEFPVHIVFGVVLVTFLIGCMLTVCSVTEKRLNKKNHSYAYRRIIGSSGDDLSMTKQEEEYEDMCEGKPVTKQIADTTSPISKQIADTTSPISKTSSDNSLMLPKANSKNAAVSSKSLSSLHLHDADVNRDAGTSVSTSENSFSMPDEDSCRSSVPEDSNSFYSDEDELQLEEADIKVFLKSIIFMPKHMWLLCLTNLFCWMSLVTYSLYFTDYVGQSIYGGNPKSLRGSSQREVYDDGVRMGSLAMVLYSLSCTTYSFFIPKLIDKLGTKAVYVGGQATYTLGMIALASTNNIVVAFLGSLTTGIMYATLFTLPYILVARYHFDPEISKLGVNAGNSKPRGLGTDVAIISSMVFAGQFILSLVLGALVHAAHSTLVVPITAAVLSFCGAMTALKVEYLGK